MKQQDVNENNVIRQLGGQELYWLLSEAYRPFNIQAEVRINNEFNSEILRKALVIIQKQQPLLNVFFDLSEFPAYSKTETPIPLFVHRANSEIEIKEIAKHDLTQTTIEENVPLMRVSMVVLSKGCVLVFTINHIISGGVELSYLIQDVLDCVDRLNKNEIFPEKKYAFPPIVESMMPSSMAEYRAPDSFQFVRNKNQKNIFTEKIVIKFGADEVYKLVAKSKELGSSLYSIILSASSFTLRDFINKVYQEEPEKIIPRVPVNFRSMLTKKINARELGSYIYGFPLDFNSTNHINEWEYAKYLTKEVKQIIQQPSKIGDALKNIYEQLQIKESTRTLIEKITNQFISKPAMIVSNLGILPFSKKIGDIELVSISFCTNNAAIFDSNKSFFIIMYSFDNELYLNVLYSNPAMSKINATLFVEMLKKRISSLGA